LAGAPEKGAAGRHAADPFFVQVLTAAGMANVGTIYIDGTKVAADASPLAGRTRAQIEAEVRRITDEARRTDEREDDEIGEGTGEELPADLAYPDARRAKLDAVLGQLDDVEARRRSNSKSRKPPRVNMTDPEARTRKGPRGWLWAFNAQAAVSEDCVIVAADVTQSPVDNSQFVPLVDQASENLAGAGGAEPDHAVADAGYWSSANATAHDDPDAPRRRPKPLIPPIPSANRPKLGTRGPVPAGATAMQVMERTLAQRTPPALRTTQDHRRARLRDDQERSRHRPVPSPRHRCRPPRMATRRYHSQPAQDLAPPARDRLRSTKHRPITPTTIPAADNPAQASNDTPPEPKRNRIYRCEPGTSLCEA
jgi:hypothetical protein